MYRASVCAAVSPNWSRSAGTVRGSVAVGVVAAACTVAGFAASDAGVASPVPAATLWVGALLPPVYAAAATAGGAPVSTWIPAAAGPPVGFVAWVLFDLTRTTRPLDAPLWPYVALYVAGSLLLASVGAVVGSAVRRRGVAG